MRSIRVRVAITGLLLLTAGMILQAHWDRSCGVDYRWDSERWECVSR